MKYQFLMASFPETHASSKATCDVGQQYVAHGAAGLAAFGTNGFRRGPVNVDVITLQADANAHQKPPSPHLPPVVPCHRRLQKMNSNLGPWLATEDVELQNAVVADIGRHLDVLSEKGDAFYGFVAVPGDYCTQGGGVPLTIAFNRESDIAPENADNLFCRYCPEEWKNSVQEGFDNTNEILKKSYEKFSSMHKKNPDTYMIDRYETAFIARRDTAIINALQTLKESGKFEPDTFLSIWFWGSHYEITDKSVKILNSPEVHKAFVSVVN